VEAARMKTCRCALALLLSSGCSVGTELKPSLEPRTELHCNGTIPDTSVMYRYTATLEVGAVVSSRVIVAAPDREPAEAATESDLVVVPFDFIGEQNGGEFTLYPIGRYLGVDYVDTDQDLYWSLLGCFDS
jgi:hypothetical protein